MDRRVGRVQTGEIGFAFVRRITDVPRPRPRSVAASWLERFDDQDPALEWHAASRIVMELSGDG